MTLKRNEVHPNRSIKKEESERRKNQHQRAYNKLSESHSIDDGNYLDK